MKNETSDHEEHEYDLDILQSEAISCFKLANKPNYAAALRHRFKLMIFKRKMIGWEIEILKHQHENLKRDDLIKRGTYENLKEEFLKPSEVKWFENITPDFEMDELPRPNLHSGSFISNH